MSNRIVIFLFLLALAAFPTLSFAESPANAYITWRANNFYPAGFAGKALPTPGTLVIVAAEVVKNGKLFDSSSATFSWSIDGRSAITEIGKKEYSFIAAKKDNNAYLVQVSVKIGTETAVGSVTIPLTVPQTVIESPFPFRKVLENTKGSVRAIPYFFNTTSFSDLLFSWRVNDFKKNTENDNQITFETGVPQLDLDRILEIVSYIQNMKGKYELATSRTRLTIIK